MSQERTRFPITPQERHETAKSFKDVETRPEGQRPRQDARPQDKPRPRGGPTRDDQDQPGEPDGESASDD